MSDFKYLWLKEVEGIPDGTSKLLIGDVDLFEYIKSQYEHLSNSNKAKVDSAIAHLSSIDNSDLDMLKGSVEALLLKEAHTRVV